MFTATTFSLALALAAPGPSDQITLKWSLKAGDTFYSKSDTTIDMNIEVLGQKIDQKQETATVMRYKVKSADAKGMVLELTYVDVKITGAAGAAAATMTDGLKGATITATLNEKMEVTKIDGQKKLLDDLSGGDATQKAMLGAILSDDAVKQIFSSLFAVTPDKGVKVGDVWSKNETMNAGGIGKITSKSKHKLGKVDKDLATIETTSDMTYEAGSGDGLPFKIAKADFKIEKASGSSVFDLKAGRLKSTKSEMTMNGTMTIDVGGQEIESKLTQKVKTTAVYSEKSPVDD